MAYKTNQSGQNGRTHARAICARDVLTPAIFWLALAAMALFIMLAPPRTARAQEPVKPVLVPITLNAETNDPQALETARKLDPDFFESDDEFFGQNTAKYYARYLPLDPTNPRRFIVLTVQDTPLWCTAHGCPIRFFTNTQGNQWRAVLDLQVDKVWYDRNTQGRRINNLISQSPANPGIAIWMWDGASYTKVN